MRHIYLHSTSIVYISEDKFRCIYITWPRVHWSPAVFVYILRYLFTYHRIKLGLLHHTTEWGKVIRHICFNTTSFVYISETIVWFICTAWPPWASLSAIFVYIVHHFFKYQRLNLGLFTECDRRSQDQTPSLFICDVTSGLEIIDPRPHVSLHHVIVTSFPSQTPTLSTH